MPNIYQPGLVQIRPQYESDPDASNTPENVLWFQSGTTTTPSLANLQSMQNIFDPAWGSLWANIGHSTFHYPGSVITDWSSNLGLAYSSVGTFTPHVGGGTGTPASPQVAALISYHVPLRYKGGHPRTYLPRLAMGQIGGTDADTIVPSTTAAMATALNTVIGNMKSSGVLGGQTMVCYLHKTTPGKAQVLQFASFTVQGLVATQRRRVRHVGRK